MDIKFLKPPESIYKELYEWRSDEFAIIHNPFAECSFEEFSKIMNDFSAEFNEIYSGKGFKWAVMKDNCILALIGLSQINKMMKTAEVGYQVGPSYRGQGIGTSVVREFVKMIFSQTDLRKLTATIADGNIPSCKIVEKAGFKQEGLLRKHFLINGIETDERIYGLMRDEVSN